MRLGIIADTHGLLRPEVFDVFAGVDRIIHAGDIGARVPAPIQPRMEGLDFVVLHGDQLGSPTPEKAHAAYPTADVIIYGHTHRPLLTTVDLTVTVMNPGGAGARRFDLPASVGIMELEAGLPPRARLVPLTPADE
mgnify:CR=1 FL=1